MNWILDPTNMSPMSQHYVMLSSLKIQNRQHHIGKRVDLEFGGWGSESAHTVDLFILLILSCLASAKEKKGLMI